MPRKLKTTLNKTLKVAKGGDRRDPEAGVLETAVSFRATSGALQSLDEIEGVSFHTFSFTEDQCVRLLLKNFGKRVPEAEILKQLKTLHINVQAVMQHRSKRRN
jgi:hypothetical protein